MYLSRTNQITIFQYKHIFKGYRREICAGVIDFEKECVEPKEE